MYIVLLILKFANRHPSFIVVVQLDIGGFAYKITGIYNELALDSKIS